MTNRISGGRGMWLTEVVPCFVALLCLGCGQRLVLHPIDASDSKLLFETWVNDQPIADIDLADHRFSIWWEQEPLRPLGIATRHTTGAIRRLQLRQLSGNESSH